MDTLVFDLKVLSWREAMLMTLGEIETAYERAAAWAEARHESAEKAAKRGKR